MRPTKIDELTVQRKQQQQEQQKVKQTKVTPNDLATDESSASTLIASLPTSLAPSPTSSQGVSVIETTLCDCPEIEVTSKVWNIFECCKNVQNCCHLISLRATCRMHYTFSWCSDPWSFLVEGQQSKNYGIIPCMCCLNFLGWTKTQQLSAWADPAFISYYKRAPCLATLVRNLTCIQFRTFHLSWLNANSITALANARWSISFRNENNFFDDQ